MTEILVTGHLGLIGRHLSPLLKEKGIKVRGFDILEDSKDIRDIKKVRSAIKNCSGVIHLAAVSRVIWAQNDPDKCWQTNAQASHHILQAALEQKQRPWVLCASSREVYGQQPVLPVREDAKLAPVNIYGEAKIAMETYAIEARTAGLNTAIVRLANVYGCTEDHHDRVLPAFCKNAVEGSPLRVDGKNNVFDFTHVSDAVDGIASMVMMLESGEKTLPPIHLLPGIATSLERAAEFAISAAKSNSIVKQASPRDYDVSRFVGNPERAQEILGWKAKISPDKGIEMLVHAFEQTLARKETLCAS